MLCHNVERNERSRALQRCHSDKGDLVASVLLQKSVRQWCRRSLRISVRETIFPIESWSTLEHALKKALVLGSRKLPSMNRNFGAAC